MEFPKTLEQVRARYQTKLEQQQATVSRIGGRWNRVGYLRGFLFLISIFLLFVALNRVAGVSVPWVWLAGFTFVAFLVVAVYHERMQFEMRTASLLANMHSESLARIARDWKNIRQVDVGIPEQFRPVAFDLDLVGDSSLFKLIGITKTPLGTHVLTSWMCDGAQPEEVELRQMAVAEMAPELDWREKFRLNCEQLAAGQSGPSQFVEWSESESWLKGRTWILWLARLTSVTVIGSVLLTIFGLIPLTVSGPVLILMIAINFFASVFYAGSMHDEFNMISSRRDEIGCYVSLFDMVADYRAKATRLKELQSRTHRPDRLQVPRQPVHPGPKCLPTVRRPHSLGRRRFHH